MVVVGIMGAAVDPPAAAELLLESEPDRAALGQDAIFDVRLEGTIGRVEAEVCDIVVLYRGDAAAIIAAGAVTRVSLQRDGQIELDLVVDILAVERDVARAVGKAPPQIAANLESLGIEVGAGADRTVVGPIITGEGVEEVVAERAADGDVATIAEALGPFELGGAGGLLAAGPRNIVD